MDSRLQNQHFLRPAHWHSDLFDPSGRFQFANGVGHFLKRGVGHVLPLNFPGIRNAKENFAARSVEKPARRCLHPAVQLAGGLLELDVFPLALAVGDEGLEFGQR